MVQNDTAIWGQQSEERVLGISQKCRISEREMHSREKAFGHCCSYLIWMKTKDLGWHTQLSGNNFKACKSGYVWPFPQATVIMQERNRAIVKVQKHTTRYSFLPSSPSKNDTLSSGTLEKGFKCKFTYSALIALHSFRNDHNQIFIPFCSLPSKAWRWGFNSDEKCSQCL